MQNLAGLAVQGSQSAGQVAGLPRRVVYHAHGLKKKALRLMLACVKQQGEVKQ
jgi:hypothetical protein